jgi:creatinine amidohydrolase
MTAALPTPPLVLAKLSWPEVAAVLPEVGVALLPTGSLEQHGPNLGLETDSAIAYGQCLKIAEQMGHRAVVLPPVWTGISSHHLDFPGTISVSTATFEAIVMDIARSLQRHGIKRLLLVNGHAGNMNALGTLCTRLRDELHMPAAVMFHFNLVPDVIREWTRTAHWGHACEIETSMCLYLSPDIVKTEHLTVGDVKQLPYRWSDPRSGPSLTVAYSFVQKTGNGAMGDARLASREAGQAMIDAAVERTVEFLEDFLRHDA